ncbi:MAG: hypothetical protein ACJ75S_04605 [Solirubrobacterales bacterium]
MKRSHSLGLLLIAIGLLAVLSVPSIAAAKQRDGNHDGIPDRWEKRHRLSTRVNQARRDQDRDRLRNRAEFMAGTNPRNADSDDDGIPDGEENAGTIASFDPASGRLVINVFGGETVSGLITEETEIECRGQKEGASASDSGEGEEGSGDEQQSQGPGDDEGDEEEPGDDQDQDFNCTAADLKAGALVHEAELEIEDGSATFEKVELIG